MENSSSSHSQKELKFGKMEEENGNNLTASPSAGSSSVSKTVFKKRPGTTNKGNEYEHVYIANLILKLILNDEIEDFYLSSNDEKFGSFDDVVVEIKYKSKNNTDFFAIQLKHADRKTTLGVEKLNAPSGDFSIKKYYEDFDKNLKLLEHPVTVILSTNCMLDSKKTKELSLDDGKLLVVKHQQNKLMSISEKEECCYMLEANEKNSTSCDEFFQKFYLYTDQLDLEHLKQHAIEIFTKNFNCDASIFNDYLSFIHEWSMTKGTKFKLDKKWMQCVVSLCILSPLIEPLPFADESVDDKGKIFREAVSKFDLTILEKENYETIKFLWSDVVNNLEDVKETNNINNRYQVVRGQIETKESLYEKDLISVNKLMWLLEKSPLVVKGCSQVYQLIKICQGKNLIILDDRKSVNVKHKTMNTGHLSVFKNLSDLKQHEQMHAEILKKFTYSLEGQKEAELSYLLGVCEDIEDLISTDDLAGMLKAPWLIGNPKEDLPPCHIERKVTKTVISFEYLKNIPDNTVAVVSGVRDFNQFKRILPNGTADAEKIHEPIHKKIYTFENYFSQEQFIALCGKNLETRFHHFKYLVDKGLEWLRSENYDSEWGDFTELEKFRVQTESSEYILDESEFFNNTPRNINIICADPGMGKSTLMKSLKNSSSSQKWTVVIYARNHALHFRHHRSDIEKFVRYVLTFTCKQCTNVLHENVFRRMMDQNRIQIIWDGLDEASDATQVAILNLVKSFSKKGIKQWLSARSNLKYTLEVKLSTLSQSIKQFDDGEQREYIKNRLHVSEQELSETFDKIRKNIVAFPNYGILGIPLQIYMLTELFLSDKTKYLNLLDDIFTVIDLYKYFVEEKFYILYQHKYNRDLSNEQNYQRFTVEKTVTINYYKIIAANSYIYNSFIWNLFNKIKIKLPWSDKRIKIFLQQIASTGDDAGFITKVTFQNNVEFAHNSYGEYFAALYLFENDVWKARDKKIISDSRYSNINFFVDLMLSKNYKGFVAVIYNNPALLEDSRDVDLKQTDCIGRDILQVACLRNNEYPVVKKSEILEHTRFRDEWVYYNPRKLKPLDYTRCQKFYRINETVDICLKKLLLFLPFLIPFFGEGDFSEEYSPTVLYYAIRFDFVMIFECIEHSVSLEDAYTRMNTRSILVLALYSKAERILQKILSEQRYYSEIDKILSFALQLPARINIEDSEGQMLTHYARKKDLTKTLRLLILKKAKLNVPDKLPMYSDIVRVLVEVIGVQDPDESGRLPIHYACECGNLDIVKLLLANGAKVDVPDRDGRLPIHSACQNFLYFGHDVVSLLIKQSGKVDLPDGVGKLPMHYACKYRNIDTIRLLIENGAKVDVPDRDGRLPIHYACENVKHGHDIVSFLIKHAAKVEVLDGEGNFPIHYACKSGSLDTVKLLLGNATKVDVADRDNRLPIHYACENFWRGHDIVSFLIKQDATVNVPDGKGNFPIHYACKSGHLNTVKVLLANGAKVDIPDRDSRLPIHYACQNFWRGRHIVSFLIKRDAPVNALDGKGNLPIHYACESGNLDTVKLLLANGGEVDVPGKDGRLPIHYACENIKYSHEIVSILIKQSAIVNVPDGEGNLPIHYACQSGSLNTVQLLLANSAKEDVPDRDGRLPIHYTAPDSTYGDS